MAADGNNHLEVVDLEARLRESDPAAVLVPPRILRRVIKRDRKLPGIGLQVPHRKSYVIDRDALLEMVDRSELGLADSQELPPTLILLAQPGPDRLASLEKGEALVRYWRLLFHARVHLALEQRLAEGTLSSARIRERINRIGRAEFEEIRIVLRQEDLLLPPRDDQSVYVEFAALYLELRFFSWTLLRRYFPAIQQLAGIDQVLAEDVDAARLFAATRLRGAPDPVPPPEEFAAEENGDVVDQPVPEAPQPSEHGYRKLMEKSVKAAALGNLVKAAIFKVRAGRLAPAGRQEEAVSAATADLDHLVDRLRSALELGEGEEAAYRRVLPAMLQNAASGLWPLEARLLYDLQKVCIDREREIYAIDLVEWTVSLGRRPIKRLLSGQQDLLALKHLHSALGRLAGARLPAALRRQLNDLLHAAIHKSEHKVRARLRPLIEATLEEVRLRPRNLPERVARAKLTEELLDRICERGFLTMGDLRDALSRNNLKLPDLAGPKEFILGDRLLRANRRLAVVLDGIYHRGEIYLRWLQRLSSVAFGTAAGRFLTLYAILPFGGSFVILEGFQHVIHLLTKLFATPAPVPVPPDLPPLGISADQGEALSDWQGLPEVQPEVRQVVHSPIHLLNWYSFILLGLFLLALIHMPRFRRFVARSLVIGFRGMRWLLVGLPAALLHLPTVRRVLDSRPYLVLKQCVLKPLLFAAPVWLILRLCGTGLPLALAGGILGYLAAGILLNSRAGRDLEEAFTDWLARSWYQVRNDIVPGLVRLILAVFKWLLEEFERLQYAVDERLRFKTGEGRFALLVKSVLGLIWFGVTYVARFCINLLIEPQINPIKHFPVVTVSHKLVLTLLVPIMARGLSTAMGLDLREAVGVATAIGFLIPGIFGFLVWELKENWRLYEANRAPTLRPVMIGHHGETMIRLLRPGFHSGTIPKLYLKLRRAQRRAQRRGRWKPYRKYQDALEHVEEAVRHFLEREFLVLLHASKSWGGAPLAVGAIDLGSNRVLVELTCPALEPASAWLALEEISGWLLAEITQPGWIPHLNEDQTRAFTIALAGLYKMSGVDLLRHQIEASFAPASFSYDMAEEGLIVWPGDHSGCEALYSLRSGRRVEPRTTACPPSQELPVLDASRLLFRSVPISWEQWVEAWERDGAGKGQPAGFVEGIHVLPSSATPCDRYALTGTGPHSSEAPG